MLALGRAIVLWFLTIGEIGWSVLQMLWWFGWGALAFFAYVLLLLGAALAYLTGYSCAHIRDGWLHGWRTAQDELCSCNRDTRRND